MVIDRILHDLISLGYFVSYKVLTASHYGVPQNRERLIILAQKLDLFPAPSSERKTLMEAISDLPEPNGVNAHVAFETLPETVAKIKELPQGGKLSAKYNFCRQRVHADKPSKTITTNNMYIHPYQDRFLTPRELARLQSFPDDFVFCGSKTSMVKQIGNAVPPLLAQKIAEKIREVQHD